MAKEIRQTFVDVEWTIPSRQVFLPFCTYFWPWTVLVSLQTPFKIMHPGLEPDPSPGNTSKDYCTRDTIAKGGAHSNQPPPPCLSLPHLPSHFNCPSMMASFLEPSQKGQMTIRGSWNEHFQLILPCLNNKFSINIQAPMWPEWHSRSHSMLI